MASKPLHVVIWFPPRFYSAVAATVVEMLELVNQLRGSEAFSIEFVASSPFRRSTRGMSFPMRRAPSRRMDVLILLAMPGLETAVLVRELESAAQSAQRMIARARRDGAIIAAHCAASYLLAGSGLLEGKRATVSWWLAAETKRRFPRVRWEPSRLLIRQGNLYTCGGGFSGLELARALLLDLGFAAEERLVRKLLVLPAARVSQRPYEFSIGAPSEREDPFARSVADLARTKLGQLSVRFLAKTLGLSARTLARRFKSRLSVTPGRWIQEQRLAQARRLLEETNLRVSEICYRIGYLDVASFSRLFARSTGMSPSEFRRQVKA